MVDYSLIKNDELRTLVMASPSLLTLSESRLQNMVERIAVLPPEGEAEFVQSLKNEKKEELKRQSSPEKIGLLQRAIEKLKEIKGALGRGILRQSEFAEQKVSSEQAENLLTNL